MATDPLLSPRLSLWFTQETAVPAETQQPPRPKRLEGQDTGAAPVTGEGTGQPAGPQGRPAAPQQPCGTETMLMFVGIFAIMYFLMIRPQQKAEKKRRAMLAAIQKGDKVVTNGGVHCEVVSVHGEEGTVVLKFGNEPGQRFKVDHGAIGRVQGEPAPGAQGGGKGS